MAGRPDSLYRRKTPLLLALSLAVAWSFFPADGVAASISLKEVAETPNSISDSTDLYHWRSTAFSAILSGQSQGEMQFHFENSREMLPIVARDSVAIGSLPPEPTAIIITPEPSSAFLTALGLLAFILFIRTRVQSS